MVIKAINNIANFNNFIPTLLIFEAYFKININLKNINSLKSDNGN